MKKPFNKLGAALCAGAMLATVGCDSIRDYSVNSYQGILPAGDVNSRGSVTPTRVETDVAKTSAPSTAIPMNTNAPVVVVPVQQ